MSKHQVLQGLNENRRKNFLFFLKIVMLVMLVVGLGVYIGDLLFGKNSLGVLLDLQEKNAMLKKEIKLYKHKNAALQKEYFELLQLEPDANEESR